MDNDITIEEMKRLMKECRIGIYPKHHEWIGEDGTHYSAWEISQGVFTGDAGIKQFRKNLLEKGYEIINNK